MTKPHIIRVGEDRRIEVDNGHYFNVRCKCQRCTEMWLGITMGDLVIMSHDGKHRMLLPGTPEGVSCPPAELV